MFSNGVNLPLSSYNNMNNFNNNNNMSSGGLYPGNSMNKMPFYYNDPKAMQMASALEDPHAQDSATPRRRIPADLSELTELIEINANELQFDVEIGRGAYGTVYKARWCGHEVACKKFAKEDVDTTKAMQFIKEMQISSKASNHPNIVRYYGFCQVPFCLVMEYMDGGSVQEYLRHDKPQSIQISPLQRIIIAKQAALGIKHLHDHKIVHRDIAARNLLMKDPRKGELHVVVSDFGMSQILNEEPYIATYTTVGPLKWMAPEALNEQKYSTKSDVYSFGITLWELLTGQEPYADVDPVNTAVEVLVSQKRPKMYETIPPKIQKLMKRCWDSDPNTRPDFAEIIQILTKFIDRAQKQQKRKQNDSDDDD
ncbi:Kelch repeat-containing protein [Reticulomyxa filosa]|uniref:Kelch repeat-containing protein n=1 Tax=Reticulomyxa filosa TaxID=46433 RepID=X6NSF5_RETFI|nr:Kelch repeat-containing protein [Reticulomyxa filosa]|eukprot:ETO29225.1 Kelch repeat-containing protein [Reticulomyxa filosa]